VWAYTRAVSDCIGPERQSGCGRESRATVRDSLHHHRLQIGVGVARWRKLQLCVNTGIDALDIGSDARVSESTYS